MGKKTISHRVSNVGPKPNLSDAKAGNRPTDAGYTNLPRMADKGRTIRSNIIFIPAMMLSGISMEQDFRNEGRTSTTC